MSDFTLCTVKCTIYLRFSKNWNQFSPLSEVVLVAKCISYRPRTKQCGNQTHGMFEQICSMRATDGLIRRMGKVIFSLCMSVHTPLPGPNGGGYPILPDRGYPILLDWGVPHLADEGVPHPANGGGGTPNWLTGVPLGTPMGTGWGCPIQTWEGGTPHPGQVQGQLEVPPTGTA